MEMVQVLPKVDEFLWRKHGHFIDGASSQVDSSERLSVLDPSTGNEIAGVANGGIQSVNAAVEAARRSLNGEWGAMRPANRERLLHNFSSVIEAYAEELAQLETINQGKSIHISRAIEVGGSVEYIRYMAGWNIYGLRLSAGRGAAQLRGQANAIDGGWTAQ